MIKNKAVLNENAMGNISQLQAEMRALKEELQKYKEGIICVQPQTVLGSAPVESMPVLKEMSLQAMYLKQKADMEKQISEIELALQQAMKAERKLKEENALLLDKQEVDMATIEFHKQFNENLEKQLAEKTSLVEELEKQIMEQELHNRKEENKCLQSENEGTTNMLEASQITVTKLKAVIDEKDDKISHLETDMRQAEDKISRLSSRVAAAEDELEEIRQQLVSLQEEIEILTDGLAHEKTLSGQLNAQISVLETEKAELGDKLSRLEVDMLNTMRLEKQGEIERLTGMSQIQRIVFEKLQIENDALTLEDVPEILLMLIKELDELYESDEKKVGRDFFKERLELQCRIKRLEKQLEGLNKS